MSDSCYSPHVYGTVCLLADEQAVSQSVFVSPYFKHKLFLGTIKQQTARVLYIYIYVDVSFMCMLIICIGYEDLCE